MNRSGQLPLFTVRGNAHTPERAAADLRVALLHHLGDLYGAVQMPEDDMSCPDCGGRLTVVLHPHCPIAYCECGFKIDIDPEDE